MRGETGGKKTWERGKGNGGMGQMRRRIWGGAEGGHCWCWNQKLEVKSCENKSNLHHCSTELSAAFHLPPTPPSFPTNPPCHSTALKWKTAFKGSEKKEIYNQQRSLFVHTYSDPSLFSLPPVGLSLHSLAPFPSLSHHNPSVFEKIFYSFCLSDWTTSMSNI